MEPMKIAVCVKPIPDPAAAPEFGDDFTLVRPEKLVMDDADRYGVELALQLGEASDGSEVVVVAMAPAGDAAALRTALSMGADRVVHVVDDALHGADALQTARVLAAVIAREGVDCVIASTESTDGYAGIMPAQLAELLELPALTYATGVEFANGSFTVTRQTARGSETVTCALPALLTVTAGIVEPRYPSFKGIMAAKSKPYDTVSLSDLSVSIGTPSQTITQIVAAESRASGEVVTDEGDVESRIVAFLKEAKVL